MKSFLIFLLYLSHRWEPLEDLDDGSVQLVESLREDIIQIERELVEGWLGAVPDFEAWEAKALQVGLGGRPGQEEPGRDSFSLELM